VTTLALDQVKYLTNLRSSQIKFEFDDSLQIGTCGGVELNQKIKASMRVPAPLGFGPQNLAGGELTRRPETSTVTASYGDSYNAVRCSGHEDSHLDASNVIAGGNQGRRRP
jgi:hypothetical protein